jgi:hypothetical protein
MPVRYDMFLSLRIFTKRQDVLLKPVLRIRIRINPHDFGLLDPQSKCGFQMRMRIRDKQRNNSADDKKN